MASTEIEFKPSKPTRGGIRGQLDSTRGFLYNPETKQVFGRTCASWGKIVLFYFVFYSCLAGFFAICLAVFFQTMNDRSPTQSGYDSLIKANPGMGFRPLHDVDYTLLKFTRGKNDTYEAMVKNLDDFIEAWKKNAAAGNGTDCSGGEQDGDDWDEDNNFCTYDIEAAIGEKCKRETDYGYYEGTPCVLIKMNKVFNWKPLPFNVTSSLPEGAPPADQFDGKHVGITCEGQNEADRDYLGDVEFFPPMGIPAQFFPYRKQPGYQTPFVFARFTKPRYGMLLQVWCKAWASNIKHHKNDNAGSVHFEMLID